MAVHSFCVRFDLVKARVRAPFWKLNANFHPSFSRIDCHKPDVPKENGARFLWNQFDPATCSHHSREFAEHLPHTRCRAREQRGERISSTRMPHIPGEQSGTALWAAVEPLRIVTDRAQYDLPLCGRELLLHPSVDNFVV